MQDLLMEDKSPRIKSFIIKNAPQQDSFTQSSFVLTLMSREYSVGHEAVKISKDGVANGNGLRATSTIRQITPRVVAHLCALITSYFDPKFLLIEICMCRGPNTTMWES